MSLKAILLLLLLDFCTKVIAGAPPLQPRMDVSQELPRLLAIDLRGDIGLRLFVRYQNCAYQHGTGDRKQKIILWMRVIEDTQQITLFISDYREWMDWGWNGPLHSKTY